MRTVSVASDLFDFSIHFFSFLIISLINLLFLLPDTFNFLNVVDKYPAHFPEDLGTLAENEPPTGYEPNDHFITEAYVEHTQESSGEQRFPDDEDEPITLKKKACRLVCRRQSVMIERGDPLFADLCRALKKLRQTTLRMNR